MNWYRIWSDGWIEQASYIAAGDNATTATITLLKPYRNDKYVVVLGAYRNGATSDGYAFLQGSVHVKTKTNFKFYLDSKTYTTGCMWFATGY